VEEFRDLKVGWCGVLEKIRALRIAGCGTQSEKNGMNTKDNRPVGQGKRRGKIQGIVLS